MVFNPTGDGNLVLADEEVRVARNLTLHYGTCRAISRHSTVSARLKSRRPLLPLGLTTFETMMVFRHPRLEDKHLVSALEVDIGMIKSQYGFGENGYEGTGKSLVNTDGRSAHFVEAPREPCATIKNMRIPEEFASGSTPSDNNQRYLVANQLTANTVLLLQMWNKYGTIRSYENADESVIEVRNSDVDDKTVSGSSGVVPR